MVSKSSRGPRLSEWYRSSYDQYKENDSRLLFWVHRTVAEIRRLRSSYSTSTRSNGRAQRNKAHNENAKNYVIMDPDFASPKISFSQLIVFAKEIAASNVTIPVSYLRLLYLSIKLRKRLAAFYSPDAGVDAEKKNSSHLHAIKQYSQVWEILKEAEERRTKKEGKDKFLHSFTVGDDPFALSEAIEQASAVFDKELSEDNEWVRDNPLIRSTAKTIYKQEMRNTFPLEEYELVVDDDDETKTKIFTHISSGAEDALRCFLVDLWDIRRYCDDIWLSVVPVGKTSHLAASFITNKAVAMVKEMEYNLLANFPMLKDLHQCYQDLDRVIKAATESFDDAHHRAEAAHRLSSQTMANTFNFLENFGKILKDGLTPAIREGAFGYFDPLANRDCMTSDDKTMEEKCILGNHLPDIIMTNMIIHIGGSKVLGTQGLAQDFNKFCDDQERNVSWALVFACQMQIDSVLARRRYLDYDLSVMRTLGRTILKEYEIFTENNILQLQGPLMANVLPFIDSLTVHVGFIEVDHVTQFKRQHGFDKPGLQVIKKDAFWLQNPWLMSNVIAEASVDFFKAGVNVIGASGSVKSLMHLWNMLRQTGYLPGRVTPSLACSSNTSPVSKDRTLLFDHLIDVFGHQIFHGSTPPKSKFFVNWQIMMGVRVETFARGARKIKKGAEYKRRLHPHGKGITSQASEMFVMHNEGYVSKKASNDKRSQNEDRTRNALAATLEIVNSELGQGGAQLTHPIFHPVGPLLNLNLFKIHRLCTMLLLELEPIVIHDLERAFGSRSSISSETRGSYLTGLIAMTEIVNRGRPDPLILKKAAEVVLKFIGDEELGPYILREEGNESLIL